MAIHVAEDFVEALAGGGVVGRGEALFEGFAFDAARAIEAPGGLGDLVEEDRFETLGGAVRFHESGMEGLVIGGTLAGEDKFGGGEIAETSALKVGGRDFVTGRHQYTSDMVRPSMLFGRVVRPEAFGATLVRLDSGKVSKGVTVVHEGDFAGVAAATPEEADRAASAIRAEWKSESQPSSKELFAYLRSNDESPRTVHEAGSVPDALASAPVKLKQTYQIAYIAHTPLEPRAAVAEWSGDRLTVWTGTQRPFGVRGELAEAFHIPEERIRVIVPDTGSGYGGKHTGEAAIEAARLAKSAGKPVKLVWSREEEFTWAYARPAGVIDVVSGATKDGQIVAWEFHNYNSRTAGIETMYTVPNQRIEFHETKSPLRQGSYRALASTANHFARESHIDELAHEVGMDPGVPVEESGGPAVEGCVHHCCRAVRLGWQGAFRTWVWDRGRV